MNDEYNEEIEIGPAESSQRALNTDERKLAEIMSMVLQSTPAFGMGSLMLANTNAQGRTVDAGASYHWQQGQIGLVTTTQCVATILDIEPRERLKRFEKFLKDE